VVLGTALLESPRTVSACLRKYSSRLIAGIDARNGRAATRGWLTNTDTSALALAARLAERGFQRVVYTDISRDGALSGPNLTALAEMVARSGMSVIASGGIRHLDDLHAARKVGAEGAIVGRALYTGDLDLGSALSAIRESELSRAS
jgi:phosphoribosylformimino-5-aminoimidazole carboxamide ribotide isomerase